MNCGRDLHSLRKLQQESEIIDDFLSLAQSFSALGKIALEILENVIGPMFTETKYLLEKILLFKMISPCPLDAGLEDSSIKSKIETISTFKKMCEEVCNIACTIAQQQDNFYNDWKETKKKWESEEPPSDQILKMSRKERKGLVKLWRVRESIAAQEKIKFDDLKAEWDAGKGRLDLVVMDCLRGVAELRGST